MNMTKLKLLVYSSNMVISKVLKLNKDKIIIHLHWCFKNPDNCAVAKHALSNSNIDGKTLIFKIYY